MKATARGLILEKPELACLLAYAGRGDLGRVTFRVGTGPLGELSAYATDSRVAVLGTSGEVFDGAQEGTWLVCAKFLKQVAVNVPKEGRALLLIEGQNLFTAEVFVAGEDPDADLFAPDDLAPPVENSRMTIGWAENAVILQADLPGTELLGPTLEEPKDPYEAASRIELSTVALSLTRHLSAVVGLDSIVMCPGREASDPVLFVAQRLNGEAVWLASVLPPSFHTGEEPKPEEKPPAPERQGKLFSEGEAPPAAEDGKVVDLSKRIRKPEKASKKGGAR